MLRVRTCQPSAQPISPPLTPHFYPPFAETAMPVIGCAACLTPKDEKDYFFSGVCRSKTVRTPDDGIGPTVDEVQRAIRSARNASSLPRSPTDRIPPRAVLHIEFGGHGDAPQHVERLDFRRRPRGAPPPAVDAFRFPVLLLTCFLCAFRSGHSRLGRPRRGTRSALGTGHDGSASKRRLELCNLQRTYLPPALSFQESKRRPFLRPRSLAARSRSPSRTPPPPNAVQPSRKSHAASSLPLPCVRRGEPIDLLLKQ